MRLDELERHMIAVVMKKYGGARGRVAEDLGIGVRTLYQKLNEKQSDPKDWDLPTNPHGDAMDLVDVLREYLAILHPDERVAIIRQAVSGYCQECGKDYLCDCKQGSKR